MRFRIVQTGSRVAALLGVLLIGYAVIAAVAPDALRDPVEWLTPAGGDGSAYALFAGGGRSGSSPAVAAVLSVFAFWFHVLTIRGYRRLPFWLAALTGSAIVLFTVGFGWTRGLPEGIRPLHQGFLLSLGLVSFVVARVTMACTYLRARRFSLTFLTAIAVLAVAGVHIPAAEDQGERIAYRGELADLIALLDSRYRELGPEVQDYLEEIARDDSLSHDEKANRVLELNREIEALQQEIARFQVVEEERLAYAEEAERLRRKLAEVESAAGLSAEDLHPVSSYQEAVRPAIPVVRDFAAGIAGEHPGSFHRSWPDPVPSRTGVEQVLAIHRYVAARWRYVNDPLYIRGNYFSPPERTIANSFVGDCDDFAILLASAVEAIGGTVRILHGTCQDSAHAWAEAYIGDRDGWRETEAVVRSHFPDRRIERKQLRQNEGYWLSLDWQVGTYTCGDAPMQYYVSGGGSRHAPARAEM
jgi:transglutaminase-like putative cysteine protease